MSASRPTKAEKAAAAAAAEAAAAEAAQNAHYEPEPVTDDTVAAGLVEEQETPDADTVDAFVVAFAPLLRPTAVQVAYHVLDKDRVTLAHLINEALAAGWTLTPPTGTE